MADIPLFSTDRPKVGIDLGGRRTKSGPYYYKERNFEPAPILVRLSPARRKFGVSKITHKELTQMGAPRRKDGNKLGLRKRRALLAWS